MSDLYVYRIGTVDLYDFDALKVITGLNKTKLQRVITKEGLEPLKYKNKHLFTDEVVMKAMEAILIEKLKRMV
jgi:hypothetical protein